MVTDHQLRQVKLVQETTSVAQSMSALRTYEVQGSVVSQSLTLIMQDDIILLSIPYIYREQLFIVHAGIDQYLSCHGFVVSFMQKGHDT